MGQTHRRAVLTLLSNSRTFCSELSHFNFNLTYKKVFIRLTLHQLCAIKHYQTYYIY